MSKRPLSITIIGWVFVCVGFVSLVAGVFRFMNPSTEASALESSNHDSIDLALVSVSAIMAVAGGAFMLRGGNCARWLCVAWMGAHVVLSVLHPLDELIVHGLLFAVVLYVLFRAPASKYFRGTPPRL